MRRPFLALIVLFAAVGAMLWFSKQNASWVVRKSLDVQVQVVDTDVPEAVVGAEVTIFPGPRSPFEGWPITWHRSRFRTGADESQSQVTDRLGVARFSYKFFASGMDHAFGDTGTVVTSGVWLRITAPGRATALVPLDRQSARARDIRDSTPIYATVVMNKP